MFFFISFRLEEFNLFAHRVSNCVPFFVKNKGTQAMAKDRSREQ
jgi:hypothetical protein